MFFKDNRALGRASPKDSGKENHKTYRKYERVNAFFLGSNLVIFGNIASKTFV